MPHIFNLPFPYGFEEFADLIVSAFVFFFVHDIINILLKKKKKKARPLLPPDPSLFYYCVFGIHFDTEE